MGIFDKIKKKVIKDEDKKIKKPSSVKVVADKEIKKDDVKKGQDKKVEKPKQDVKATVKGRKIAYDVLVRPLITEKVTDMGAFNKYAFEISIKSNKQEVKKAVQEVYGVTPISVNIINTKGKKTRSGRRAGKRKDWKKAIITLKKGEKIEVYEGV
ncbi:50S ribosomal protein L23 [Candidatus Falkowbacteria bacterium]|jgi:large subunit ribosomal protein L23|nr:50S ribosomal protein L23 [Candidatus Falkowbacteria bacterium]MBT4432996.1 50S ribosomal protein L23 [Candidatus Falkowbacteria bacterium]